ncbi:MAG TPA: helix-turn-helix transcriptional regulator, partial [Acidimicrobiales bacterium]
VVTDAQDTVIAAPMPGSSGEGIFDGRPLRACRRRRAPRIVVREHAVGAKAAADPVVTPFDRQRVALRPHPVPAPPAATRASRPLFGWDSLTATERTLASIVGQGLTNKQAAARLFVSRHTVDSHLRHIFRKLDINSRVELAALVAKCQPDDERVSA